VGIIDKSARCIATGGFVGNLPLAPGTWGSLAGLPICFLLSRMPFLPSLGVLAVLIGVALWSSHRAERALGETDPGCIIVDEVAGMVLALFCLPFSLLTALAGFVLFRTLDIIKPFPISLIEKRWTGGVAVVADDLAAGLAANAILRIVISIPGFRLGS